tara:strand:+ start:9604 stop:11211 length:1608 start_codon:yes stop_codon:yes gene_type:complete
MTFFELEQIMHSMGVTSLAEIARTLETTPQAVSNWKARNKIPYHIVAKIKVFDEQNKQGKNIVNLAAKSPFYKSDENISLSSILLAIVNHIKIIVMVSIIFIFLGFLYVQFIKVPLYTSKATVLIAKTGTTGSGLGQLASRFGVTLTETADQVDLSDPNLLPELLTSDIFNSRILNKEFYTEKYGKKLPLLAILTHGLGEPQLSNEELYKLAKNKLSNIISYEKRIENFFSTIRISSFSPYLSKELAHVVIEELSEINKFYKTQNVIEKTRFIEMRIATVQEDLEKSEEKLKTFQNQNLQISSPNLLLEQEKLITEVDIQKNIYITLKNQLEMAKIELIQKGAALAIVDPPILDIVPINKNLKLTLLLNALLGISLGTFIAFFLHYLKNTDSGKRRKLKTIYRLFTRNILSLLQDKFSLFVLNLLLLIGLPFLLSRKSVIPVFFGLYSTKAFIFVVVYNISIVILFILLVIAFTKKNPKSKRMNEKQIKKDQPSPLIQKNSNDSDKSSINSSNETSNSVENNYNDESRQKKSFGE